VGPTGVSEGAARETLATQRAGCTTLGPDFSAAATLNADVSRARACGHADT